MPRSTKSTTERPFTTDYAGAWKGYCKTRESAINAAVKHVTNDGYTNCTITGTHSSQGVHVHYDYKTKTITITAKSYLHAPTSQPTRGAR